MNAHERTHYLTALHRAALSLSPATVGLLLEAGADVNALTTDGRTALSIAEEFGHQPVIDALKRASVRSESASVPDPNER